MFKSLKKAVVCLFCGFAMLLGLSVFADERRAPAPKFSKADTEGIFYENLTDAIRGQRPSLSALRGASAVQVANVPATSQPSAGGDSGGGGKWSKLVSAVSLEDEVKRVKLHYDSIITTPAAFNGGGYQDARLDLSILAVMFGVIHEYGGEVRWKKQAATARDVIARTAFNCKAGSTQVYNEAKLRRDDLQDLISGGGLSKKASEEDNDWSMIVDRSPMMEYGVYLRDSLKTMTSNEGSFKSNVDQVKREAELLALLGQVFIQEGMDDYDDEDYAGFSNELTKHSVSVVEAVDRGDYDAVRKGVGAAAQACDDCHDTYR